jgi:hypothetical protein
MACAAPGVAVPAGAGTAAPVGTSDGDEFIGAADGGEFIGVADGGEYDGEAPDGVGAVAAAGVDAGARTSPGGDGAESGPKSPGMSNRAGDTEVSSAVAAS